MALAVYLVSGRKRALDFTGGPIGAASVACYLEIRRLDGIQASDVGWGLWLAVAGIALSVGGLALIEIAHRKRAEPSPPSRSGVESEPGRSAGD